MTLWYEAREGGYVLFTSPDEKGEHRRVDVLMHLLNETLLKCKAQERDAVEQAAMINGKRVSVHLAIMLAVMTDPTDGEMELHEVRV